MRKHWTKAVAPLVITGIIIVYYVIYFAVLMALLEGFWRYLLGIIPLSASALAIYVCRQRICEIRSGEEDDLSQY